MEVRIGIVDDYFAKVGVAALILEGELKSGDTVRIKGHTTDLTQGISSMQIQHLTVSNAKKGDSIGIKVSDRVRKGDIVYKITP